MSLTPCRAVKADRLTALVADLRYKDLIERYDNLERDQSNDDQFETQGSLRVNNVS